MESVIPSQPFATLVEVSDGSGSSAFAQGGRSLPATAITAMAASSMTISNASDSSVFLRVDTAGGTDCSPGNSPVGEVMVYRVAANTVLHLPFPSPWVVKSAAGSPCFRFRAISALPGRGVVVQIIGTFN